MPRRAAVEGAVRSGKAALSRPASVAGPSASPTPLSATPAPTPPTFTPRTSFLLPSNTPSWYPGHMQRALRSLPALLTRLTPVLPLVIEVRDARLPLTSINPALEAMLRRAYGGTGSSAGLEKGQGKGKGRETGASESLLEWEQRRLVVYTKRDLVSSNIEEPLAAAFMEHGQRLMFVDTRNDRDVRRIHKWALAQARILLRAPVTDQPGPSRSKTGKLVGALRHTSTPDLGVRVIIMGMPNVGKSTLINALRRVGVGRGKAVATAPHPGHTRKVAGTVRITPAASTSSARRTHEDGTDQAGSIPGRDAVDETEDPPIYVYDTPGIMVPFLGRGVRGSERGLKLALAAGIRTELFDSNMLADYLLFRFNLRHAYNLQRGPHSSSNLPERTPQPAYLSSLPISSSLLAKPTNDIQTLLHALAHRVPGALSKGGVPDLDAAAEFMVQRWREGRFGPAHGELDLGLGEVAAELVGGDGERERVGEEVDSAVQDTDADANAVAHRIRRLVRRHFEEVAEAQHGSSLDEHGLQSNEELDQDHTEEDDSSTSASTPSTTAAQPLAESDAAREMPVLLSNHQARKRAKRTYLESQRAKYRAQGLVRKVHGWSASCQSEAARVRIEGGRRSVSSASRHGLCPNSSDEVCAMQQPVSSAEFALAMSKLVEKGMDIDRGLALSISGGVDSMALAFLASRWRAKHAPGLSLQAVVIDHGLRKESGDEARLTVQRLKELGLDAEIRTITWNEQSYPPLPPPGTSFEATARLARRLALLHVLTARDLSAILFGHHADDQVETAVLRAARGSRDLERGSDGLGGMRGVDGFGAHALLVALLPFGMSRDWLFLSPWHEQLKIGRPLLSFPKARLRATCQVAGVDWAEDPTNQDVEGNARNLVRRMLAGPAHGGDPYTDASRHTEPKDDTERTIKGALEWCLEQARAATPAAKVASLTDALRAWVSAISARRDQADERVATLLKRAASRLPDSSKSSLFFDPHQIDPSTPQADLEHLLRALINCISPHPLNSSAARGLGAGVGSPSAPSAALAERWLRPQARTHSGQGNEEEEDGQSRVLRVALNGDVLLEARRRRRFSMKSVGSDAALQGGRGDSTLDKAGDQDMIVEARRAPLRSHELEDGRLTHVGRVAQDGDEDKAIAEGGALHHASWRLWDGRYFLRVLRTQLSPISSSEVRSLLEGDVGKDAVGSGTGLIDHSEASDPLLTLTRLVKDKTATATSYEYVVSAHSKRTLPRLHLIPRPSSTDSSSPEQSSTRPSTDKQFEARLIIGGVGLKKAEAAEAERACAVLGLKVEIVPARFRALGLSPYGRKGT